MEEKSKTQVKQEMLALTRLAEDIVKLSPGHLQTIPMDESLAHAISEARRANLEVSVETGNIRDVINRGDLAQKMLVLEHRLQIPSGDVYSLGLAILEDHHIHQILHRGIEAGGVLDCRVLPRHWIRRVEEARRCGRLLEEQSCLRQPPRQQGVLLCRLTFAFPVNGFSI